MIDFLVAFISPLALPGAFWIPSAPGVVLFDSCSNLLTRYLIKLEFPFLFLHPPSEIYVFVLLQEH